MEPQMDVATMDLVGSKKAKREERITLDEIRDLAATKKVQTEQVYTRPVAGFSMLRMPSPNPSSKA
jgi:hypothetical protein